jgi:hypothetical protein
MKQSATETLKRLEEEGFCGTLTIHMNNGRVRKIEQLETWKPPREPDETVDITEARKRA